MSAKLQISTPTIVMAEGKVQANIAGVSGSSVADFLKIQKLDADIDIKMK